MYVFCVPEVEVKLLVFSAVFPGLVRLLMHSCIVVNFSEFCGYEECRINKCLFLCNLYFFIVTIFFSTF